MKAVQSPKLSEKEALWQNTNVTNLIRYVPSGKLFARVRISGKLKRRSMKTEKISVAQLRLSDFIKGERSVAENQEAVTSGK